MPLILRQIGAPSKLGRPGPQADTASAVERPPSASGGFVHRRGEPIGAYFVAWTQGKPDHGAKFDLILGQWGNSAAKDDRYSVALDYRLIDGAPQFMVVDALNRATSGSPLVGAALKRSDVIGTPLAPQVFAIVDAVHMSESTDEVRHWSGC